MTYDTIIIGGGAAGLSAGLMLARARRSVLVIDAGEPRNAPAEGVHGLLARDGMPPLELVAQGRAEVARYGGELLDDRVTGVTRDGDHLAVARAGGPALLARRIILATGLVDELPDVPGLAEHWGRSVVHCPYCHGWEVRDRAIGILGTGERSIHQALLWRQWSDDVVLFLNDAVVPSAEESAQLAARGVRVTDGRVTHVVSANGSITGLALDSGDVVAREVVAVATVMRARGDFLAPLGLTAVPHPSGAGEHVPSDEFGRTAVEGVWAAGNVTDPFAQVGGAAAAGALAAAHVNMDLVTEDTRRAVES